MIRPAERSDLDRVLPLLHALEREGSEADPRYRSRPATGRLVAEAARDLWFRRQAPFPGCLLAEVPGAGGSEPAGFLAAVPEPPHPWLDQAPTARIDALFVRPEHRRRGLAHALVEELRRRASAAGYPRLEVHTLALDGRALAFWRSQGFTDLRIALASEEPVSGTGR